MKIRLMITIFLVVLFSLSVEPAESRPNIVLIFMDNFGYGELGVYGGGITGQAEAVRLAISRALCEVDAENRTVLKPEGLLTRDPRMVERKKYGRKKARKKFQFSKR